MHLRIIVAAEKKLQTFFARNIFKWLTINKLYPTSKYVMLLQPFAMKILHAYTHGRGLSLKRLRVLGNYCMVLEERKEI